MYTFKTNRTYTGRFICDSDSIVNITILGRTAKQVTIKVHGGILKRKIHIWYDNTSEYFYPYGQHSMALIIKAERSV